MFYSDSDFPSQLVVELTAGCNQSCIFCGRTYMVRPKKTMSDQMFKQIVDEVAQENPYTELWPTFMGEAMLLGDTLFDLIAYAKQAGLQKITLNTNGTRFTPHNIERLLNCGLNRLIISCDAYTPQTHATVRPPLNPNAKQGLEIIYAGIHAVLDAIERHDGATPLVEVQFSIFDENEHEVEAFREYWHQYNVIVKVRPKVYWSGSVAGGEHRLALDERRKPCLWAFDSAAIQWNGNVVMCPIDCDGKYVAGNIQLQSLKEIWGGSLRWIRELHRQERFRELPQICRECPDWEVKKAHTYYPTESIRQSYEDYINLGRTFTEAHFWQEDREKIR